MKVRNSNIEILRIISMFMILLSHYTVHNGIDNFSIPIGFNRYLLEICTLGNIGVIIFVLITGFFSINQKEPFKLKKLVLLILQVLFYSLSIYFLFVVLGIEKFTFVELLKNLLPIAFKKYWFMTAFIILYIFIPYLNIFLNSLNEKQYFKFLIVSLIIFSILPMITTKDYLGNELIQFILFYSIGAFLAKYENHKFLNKKNINILFYFSILVLILSPIFFDILGQYKLIFAKHSTCLYNRNSIISIIFSISLFCKFKNLSFYSNKLINKFSSYILGVYLISDNYLIRRILWIDILKVPSFVNSNYLLAHLVVSVIIVFLICIFIEFIRSCTFEKIIDKIYDVIEKKNKKNLIELIVYFFR